MTIALPRVEFEVRGTPNDYEGARDLAERDKHQFQLWACATVNAQPYRGGKKGADSGIDGILYFKDDEKTKKIIVSVKGGENVHVKEVRDLRAVIEREKAEMGFFVTLNAPTKPMVGEAAAAGFYTSPLAGANKYPRLQILTIEGLLNGKEQPRYPRMDASGLTFKKAKIDQGTAEQKKLPL